MRSVREGGALTHDLCSEAVDGRLSPRDMEEALAAFRQGVAHPGLRATQLRAMDELMRGAAATCERVAAFGGCDPSTLKNMARREGWAKLDNSLLKPPNEAERALDAQLARDYSAGRATEQEAIAAQPVAAAAETGAGRRKRRSAQPERSRAERVAMLLVKHADRLLEQVEAAGGTLARSQLEALLAMFKLAEKFEPMARQEAVEAQKRKNERTSRILGRINGRILDVGEELAAWLVAQRLGGEAQALEAVARERAAG